MDELLESLPRLASAPVVLGLPGLPGLLELLDVPSIVESSNFHGIWVQNGERVIGVHGTAGERIPDAGPWNGGHRQVRRPAEGSGLPSVPCSVARHLGDLEDCESATGYENVTGSESVTQAAETL